MNCAALVSVVRDQMPSLFECAQMGDDLEISTPFQYPDGDTIKLTMLAGEDPGVYVLTDYGDSLSYLAGHGVFLDDSTRRLGMVRSCLAQADAAIHREAVYTVVQSQAEIPAKLMALSQCLVRILDLAHTTVTPIPVSFFDEVLAHVEQLNTNLVPKKRLRHLLGRKHPAPDFGIARGSSLTVVKALSATSQARIQPQVNQVVRIFEHVVAERPRWRPVTILDDSLDVWAPEWIKQMSRLSRVFRWNEQREEIDAFINETA